MEPGQGFEERSSMIRFNLELLLLLCSEQILGTKGKAGRPVRKIFQESRTKVMVD